MVMDLINSACNANANIEQKFKNKKRLKKESILSFGIKKGERVFYFLSPD